MFILIVICVFDIILKYYTRIYEILDAYCYCYPIKSFLVNILYLLIYMSYILIYVLYIYVDVNTYKMQ